MPNSFFQKLVSEIKDLYTATSEMCKMLYKNWSEKI